jgi:p-aminobenzoyl-glutamate transporter AbgT
MWYFVAGSVFLALSIAWWFIQKSAERNKKYEDAKRDKQKAIDDSDTPALLDAERRMRLYR